MNASAAFPPVQRWRLRASDFELLHEAGALDDVRRAELIDGDIYGMSPQLARHSRFKMELAFAIRSQLPNIDPGLTVMVEVSVVVAEDSVPEPDIVVSTYQGDRYVPANTVLLAVEIADSTLDRDLGRKAALYAAAGIPEYWVVDVNAARILTHRQPQSEGYLDRNDVAFGDTLLSTAIVGLEVNVDRLLS